MTLTKSKWMFAGVWLGGAGIVFALLVVQSLVGRYGEDTQAAWAWYLPTVMPTLSLIIGVLASDFRATPDPAKPMPEPSRGLLWMAMGLSVFYLLLVATTILVQPFLQAVSPIELMHRSNLWLGPLQGLTAGALAAFFRNS
jgi:uncharacterized membrane protein